MDSYTHDQSVLNQEQTETIRTDFADVHVLSNGIVECVPYENLQLTASNIDMLDQLMRDKKLLLINLANHFSINFKGILRARNMQHVRAIALVSDRNSMKSFPATLLGKEHLSLYPYCLFSTRKEAIAWLQAQ